MNVTKNSLDAELSQIMAKFKTKLNDSEILHNSVAKPFTVEQLQLTTTNDDGTRVIETVSLMERLQEHRTVIEKESRELKNLWTDWTKTRQELTCMGVEVLGVAFFDLNTWANDAEFQGRLAKSSEVCNNEQTFLEEIQAQGKQFGEEVKDLSAESIQAMSETQKVYPSTIPQAND
jgi:hypothetical protein